MVRTDDGHGDVKPYATSRQEAKDWAEKVKFKCPVLVDNDEQDYVNHCRGRRRRTTWGIVYVLSKDGHMVYDGGVGPWDFPADNVRGVCDMLLDPKLRNEVEAGFPSADRALPRKEERKEGVAYVEDFESYKDTYDYRKGSRWGQFPMGWGKLEKGKGLKGSTAVHFVDAHDKADPRRDLTVHALVKPLEKGHIQFHIFSKTGGLAAVFRVYGEGGKLAGTFESQKEGGWSGKTASFALDGKPTGTKFTADAWQTVRIQVQPGTATVVSVNGKKIGELPAGAVEKLGIGCATMRQGLWLDDVEILYAK